ncbi:MAG: hypothetical protein ACYC2Y_01295 [Armatimonadota bacterium]
MEKICAVALSEFKILFREKGRLLFLVVLPLAGAALAGRGGLYLALPVSAVILAAEARTRLSVLPPASRCAAWALFAGPVLGVQMLLGAAVAHTFAWLGWVGAILLGAACLFPQNA